MTTQELLQEWRETLACRGYDLANYPEPDKWHDLRDELEYERASFEPSTPDKEIADNVRFCQWLSHMGAQWEAAVNREWDAYKKWR